MSDSPSRDSHEEFDSTGASLSGSEVMTLKPIVRKVIPDEEKFRVIHVIAYIFSAVLGREYSGWNSTLSSGFGMFGVAQLLTAGACLGYYLCLSEIWSAIPFSGGSYGLSRASLGFYVGFLDGCCEALVYVCHSAISAMGLSMRLVLLFELPSHFILLFCFIAYAISVWLTAQKSLYHLRRAYMTLALIAFLILVMYLLGMLKYVNFLDNAPLNNSPHIEAVDNWFVGGMKEFMRILPLSVTPYAGVKSFVLLTIVTKDPKRTLPNAVLIAFAVIFALNMVVIFVVVSQPGGILKTSTLGQPMIVGNQLMFKLDPKDTFRLTTLLSLPGSFSKVLTYILPAGNLFHCLGNSYYLPPFLCLNKTQDRTNGCIVTAVFGMLLCVIIHFNPTIDLYNVTILATMITCCTFVYSYVQLRTTYSNVERSFVSPWGISGALFTFLFFALIGVAAAFYQDTWFNLQFAAVYVAVLTLYYFTVARSGDSLGEEEDKIFFQLHVRNFNINRRKKRAKKAASAGARKGQVVPTADGSHYSDHSQSILSRIYHNTRLSSRETSVRSKPQSHPLHESSGSGMSGGSVEAFDEVEEIKMLQLGSSSKSEKQFFNRSSKKHQPSEPVSGGNEETVTLGAILAPLAEGKEDGEGVELFGRSGRKSVEMEDLLVQDHHEDYTS